MQDRRAAERIQVSLRCHVTLTNGGTHRVPREGITENISRKGVLVRVQGEGRLADTIRPGDFLEADIELPTQPHSMPRSLYCRGAAVWSRKTERDLLLAISVEYLKFRDLPKRFGLAAALAQALPM